MSADLAGALADRGIQLKQHQPGEHRAPCPECDRGPRDDALAVRLERDGSATWICHRCDFRGGIGPTINGPAAAPQLQPERHATLSPWGRTLWENSRPIEPGTIAATYLEGRRCAMPPGDGDLRWHPALSDKVSGYTGPALVGLVTNVETSDPINLHRTWLAPDGSGKAPIDKPRRLLKGHSSYGGVIRLWPDDEVTIGLVVGEGIETALAAATAGLVPVWAVLSAGNLAEFPVLPGLEGITILVDHDRPNRKTGRRAGIEAARAVVERYTRAGFDPKRSIKVILPDVEGHDVADLVSGS